jgi:hypothetical protein
MIGFPSADSFPLVVLYRPGERQPHVFKEIMNAQNLKNWILRHKNTTTAVVGAESSETEDDSSFGLSSLAAGIPSLLKRSNRKRKKGKIRGGEDHPKGRRFVPFKVIDSRGGDSIGIFEIRDEESSDGDTLDAIGASSDESSESEL